jgi:hypothetical protein
MAIAVIMDFTGGTLEDYDRVVARLGLTPDGPGAPGGLFHWVAATENGAKIVDVWRTREQADEFYQNQLGPITAELGIDPPEISYFDVHNTQTAGPEK